MSPSPSPFAAISLADALSSLLRIAGSRALASLAHRTPPQPSTAMFSRSLRPLAGLARPVASSSPSLIARGLATEAARPLRSGEYTTVEDLHAKTAHEILHEREKVSQVSARTVHHSVP